MSLVFKVIRWKNLLSTGNAFTSVEFQKNRSTLIIGENGSGKSTLLDAISFVLYGTAFRKINKPALINSVNGKNMLVEIEFTTGGNDFVIRRGMKPNVFDIIQNGQLINQTAAIKDYQVFLEKTILKMNRKTFTQIIVLGSSTFIPFMELTPALRRSVIEDLLDLEIYSSMNIILKERIQDNKSDIKDADNKIEIANEKISIEKEHIAKIMGDQKEMIEEKKKLRLKFETGNEDIKSKIVDLLVDIGELSQKTVNKLKLEEYHENIKVVMDKLDNKVKKVNKDLEFFKHFDSCPTCKQSIDSDFKKDILEKRSVQLEENSEAVVKLQAKQTEIWGKLTEIFDINAQIVDLQTKQSRLELDITTNNRFIRQIDEEVVLLEAKAVETKRDKNNLLQYQTELKDARVRKVELNEEAKFLRLVAEMLKDTGIKSRIIKQYVPVMNKLINHYLQKLGFFVQFELDENFNEKIKSRYRDDFSYESFSEGEKKKIDIAILMTWRTIAKMRNSISSNLLIMDEIFDSSFDANATDEFLKIIYDLTNDTNTFIISHKVDFLIDKFDNVLRFQKHGNFSTMEG